jgi:hypothetical protein
MFVFRKSSKPAVVALYIDGACMFENSDSNCTAFYVTSVTVTCYMYLMTTILILFDKDTRSSFYQHLSTVSSSYSVTVYIKLYNPTADKKLKLRRNTPHTI